MPTTIPLSKPRAMRRELRRGCAILAEHATDLIGITLVMAITVIAVPLFTGWSAI